MTTDDEILQLHQPHPPPCVYCGSYNIVEDGFAPRCQEADCTAEMDAINAAGKGRHPLFGCFECDYDSDGNLIAYDNKGETP